MPGKKTLHKKTRKHRRRTLRRKRRGGADSQSLIPPDTSFGREVGTPVNSDNAVHNIA